MSDRLLFSDTHCNTEGYPKIHEPERVADRVKIERWRKRQELKAFAIRSLLYVACFFIGNLFGFLITKVVL